MSHRPRTRTSASLLALTLAASLLQAAVGVSASAYNGENTKVSYGWSASGPTEPTGYFDYPSIDANGDRVAFQTTASLDPGDTNGVSDVYVIDRDTNNDGTFGDTSVILASRSATTTTITGTPVANGASRWPTLSVGGNYVTYVSEATDLIDDDRDGAPDDDGNAAPDVYRFDVDALTNVRISVDSAGNELPAGIGLSDTMRPAVSRDGLVAYVAADGFGDWYAYVGTGGPSVMVSTWSGVPMEVSSPDVDLSDARTHVAFTSVSDPDGLFNGGLQDVFLHALPEIGLTGGTTSRVTFDSDGGGTNGASFSPRLNDDGTVVAFGSYATDIDSSAGSTLNVYVRDGSGTRALTTLTTGAGGAFVADVDTSGRYVALTTAQPLISTDTNTVADVYVVDAQTGAFKVISRRNDYSQTIALSAQPWLGQHAGWVVYVSHDNQIVANDNNPLPDVFVHQNFGAPNTSIRQFGFSVGSGDFEGIEVGAGASSVPITAIPPESLRLDTVGIGAVPLRSVDLADTPLRSVPLRSVPLRSVALSSVPLRSVQLSQIPLRSVTVDNADGTTSTYASWQDVLLGTALAGVPLQNVTLGDAFADSTVAARLDALPLRSVDLSSTPLRSVSLAAIGLGATPLRSVWVDGPDGTAATSDAQSVANWQAWLASFGYPGTITGDETMLALELADAPLRSVPLRSVPLRSVALAESPLRSVPLRSVELSATPLRSVPLRSVLIDAAVAPLRSVPLANIPNVGDIIDCGTVDCVTGTLGDAVDADIAAGGEVVFEHATLADLAGQYGDTTLGDLVDGLDVGDLTLADVIIGLLLATDYPWEELPLDEMDAQLFASAGGSSTFGASWIADGNGASAPTTLTVQLPPGAVIVGDVSLSTTSVGTDSGLGSASLMTPPARSGTVVLDLGSQPTSTADVTHTHAVSFEVAASMHLGNGDAIATVDVGDATDAIPLNVTVNANHEPASDDPATAPVLTEDVLYTTHLDTSDDIDYFRIPVPAERGKRVKVWLSHLADGLDADLVVYSPDTAPSAAPLRSVPLRSVPLRSVPLDDDGAAQDPTTNTVTPDTLRDVPLRSVPLRSVSANRSNEDEVVEFSSTSTDLGAGHYVIQVSGFNGTTSSEPVVLRYEVTEPPAPPACSVTLPYPVEMGPPSAGLVRWHDEGQSPDDPADDVFQTGAAPPTDTDTLVLANWQRLRAFHGTGVGTHGDSTPGDLTDAVDSFLSGADDLAGNPTTAAVVNLDADSVLGQLYDAWDQAACDPQAANAVAERIIALIDALRVTRDATGAVTGTNLPQLRNIVLVGGDESIPMARVPDVTRIANEATYAIDAKTVDATGAVRDNPLTGAMLSEHVLSDDPYGDLDPIPWLDRTLFVPDLAIGRVVEAPADIAEQFSRFIDPAVGGMLNPTSAMTTGYDFLTDGTGAVADALTGNGQTVDRSLEGDNDPADGTPWDRSDVLRQLYPAGGSPDVVAINAHYDHHRSLPSAGNATHDESDLFEIDDLVTDVSGNARPALTGRIAFTMGCHAGLAVPDGYVLQGNAGDWAQTYSAQEASVYVANTGYGYGDTEAVALSERLMLHFAERLDGAMSVGQALAGAKQEYFAGLGVYGPYDEKALMEATFYGLPMYRLGTTPPTATAPTPPALGTDGTGLTTASIPFSPSFTAHTGGDGTFFTVGTQLPQVTHGRPIQPRTERDVTQPGGPIAHGAFLTGLSSHDQTIDPVVARPTIDLSANEPEPPAGDVGFPSSLMNLSSFTADDGSQRQRLVVMPGQFSATGGGTGQQRLFDSLDVQTYYSNSTDHVAPTLRRVEALTDGSTVHFVVAGDDGGTTADRFGTVRANVLYKVAGATTAATPWTPVELSWNSLEEAWTADVAISSDIEFIAQVLDAAGNVAVSTNKARYYGTVELGFAGVAGGGGWYRGPVTVTIGDAATTTTTLITATAPGTTYLASVDGRSVVVDDGRFVVEGDGDHQVVVTGSDGSRASVEIRIDTTGPSVGISSPQALATYGVDDVVTPDVQCSDQHSGVATCPSPPVDTSTPGEITYSVTATDVAGNSATSDRTYTVIDDVAPVITDLSVDPGAVTPEGTATVTAGVVDGHSDVSVVEVLVDGVVNGSLAPSATASTYAGTLAGLAVGTHTVQVRARDGAATPNETTSGGVTLVVSQAPAISGVQLGSSTIRDDGSTTLSATVTDDGVIASVTALLDGEPWDTMDPGTTAGTYSASVSGLPVGSYAFQVRATDEHGLTTTSSAVTLTVGPSFVVDGFFDPVVDGTNKVRAGRTVPIKFRILRGDELITDPGVVSFGWDYGTGCYAQEPSEIATTTDAASSELRWDETTQQFIYNWKTDRTWTACRDFRVSAGSDTRTAHFVFTR